MNGIIPFVPGFAALGVLASLSLVVLLRKAAEANPARARVPARRSPLR